MILRSTKKKGIGIPIGFIIGLVFAVILVFIIWRVYGLQIQSWLNIDEDDQDTINTVKLLRDAIVEVSQPANTCVSTSIPFNIESHYAIVGYDKYGTYTRTDGGLSRIRPPSCRDRSCICLYDTDEWHSNPGNVPEYLEQGLVKQGTFYGCLLLQESIGSISGPYALSEYTANYGAKKSDDSYDAPSEGIPYADLFISADSSAFEATAFDGNLKAQNLYVEYYKPLESSSASLFISLFFVEDQRFAARVDACQNEDKLTV